MIPKTIHYCWYGGKPLPELAIKCMKSWEKYCPDYEIVRWDESNTDLNENDYIREAFEAKKWAFITHYIRLKVLYEHGGIYMDTDVEVCGSLDGFLNDRAFSGFEDGIHISTGIMASEKKHEFFEKLLTYYKGKHFLLDDGTYDMTTNVNTITRIANENGFRPNDTKQVVCNMTIYPHDYFSPKDYETEKVNQTKNTVCIHHFNGSWVDDEVIEWRKWKRLNLKYGRAGDYLYALSKYLFHPGKFIKHLKEKNNGNRQEDNK